MGLNSENKPKKQQQIPPAGLNLAVCYSIIDLGTQEETFPGKPSSLAAKCHFSWEFPSLPLVTFDEKKGPQPMAVFQEYTVSAGEKAKLPAMLCSWGKMERKALKSISAQLLKAFIGAPCMINVTHVASKTQTDSETGFPIMYSNVGQSGLAVMPMMEGMQRPQGTKNPTVFFELDNFTWPAYLALPQFIQEKIAKSKEWPGILQKYPKPVDNTTQQNTAQVNPAAQMPVTPGISNPVNNGGPSF